MKKRRRNLILLALLLIPGMTFDFFVCEYRQAQRDHALIAAVEAQDTQKTLAALAAGADVNTRDYSDSFKSLPDTIRHCIHSIITLRAFDKPERRPTLLARLIESGDWVNKRDGTFLIQRPENPQLTAILLDNGADVHARDLQDATPLLLAASHGFNTSISLLIQHGSDVNAQTLSGETPLMSAVRNEHPQTVRLLLDHHADINRKDRSGSTAFDYAFADKSGNVKDVELLWRAGAKTGQELTSHSAP